MVRWIFVFLASIASAASAEDSWTAPELVPDNPVLQVVLRGQELPGAILSVFGTESYEDRYIEASADFWMSVMQADQLGLISDARAVDAVALSYFPPLVVIFPTSQSINELRAFDGQNLFGDWDDVTRRVWVIDTRELDDRVAASIYLLFKLETDQGEQPGICHARQVVRVLYTGEANDVELSNCLKAQSTK